MQGFFDGIEGVILIVVFLIGFILLLQFMSKISGNNISQKYGSGTVRPDDLDESMKLIKNTTEQISFKIKVLGLSKFEKIILKFEKILNSPSNYKYSIYCPTIERYSKFNAELKVKEDFEKDETDRKEREDTPIFRLFSADNYLTFEDKIKLGEIV